MKARQGEITISRVACSPGPDHVMVRVRDSETLTKIIEVRVALVEWAELFTGRSAVPCEVDLTSGNKR